MLQSYTSHARWSWVGVLDFLDHTEVASVARVCRAFHSQVRALQAAGEAPRTLLFNGLPNCAALLAAAAAQPLLCSAVRAIHFEFCNALQNFDLVPLGRFSKLTCLNINACRNLTDSALEVVSEQCRSLQRLEVYWDVVFSDVSINALAAAPFPPLLTHLNLSGLKHVTDAALVPLLRQCTSLTYLDLTRCEGIKDESLKAVGRAATKLRTLLLYATPNITDAGITELARGCPLLTHLDLTGNKLITDAGVKALAQHCPALRVLYLMWCTPLTDASIRALGETPSAEAAARAGLSTPVRDMRLLSLHGNVYLTAEGMEALARGCPRIEQLDINGCKSIGVYRNSKAELRRIFPHLQQLTPM